MVDEWTKSSPIRMDRIGSGCRPGHQVVDGRGGEVSKGVLSNGKGGANKVIQAAEAQEANCGRSRPTSEESIKPKTHIWRWKMVTKVTARTICVNVSTVKTPRKKYAKALSCPQHMQKSTCTDLDPAPPLPSQTPHFIHTAAIPPVTI